MDVTDNENAHRWAETALYSLTTVALRALHLRCAWLPPVTTSVPVEEGVEHSGFLQIDVVDGLFLPFHVSDRNAIEADVDHYKPLFRFLHPPGFLPDAMDNQQVTRSSGVL